MDWQVIEDNIPFIANATVMTIILAITTIALSVALAFPLALMRDASLRPLRWIAAAYSWSTRATPTLTLLFLTYYGLPQLGIYFDPLTAAIVGLTVSAAGYNMEYIRAGLRSVPATQHEAARALGIPPGMALRRLIVPQALRVILPPLTSNLTLLLKGTSIASLVAVSELTGEGMALISTTYKPIEILAVIAVIYLILNAIVIGVQHVVQHRFGAPVRRPA